MQPPSPRHPELKSALDAAETEAGDAERLELLNDLYRELERELELPVDPPRQTGR